MANDRDPLLEVALRIADDIATKRIVKSVFILWVGALVLTALALILVYA